MINLEARAHGAQVVEGPQHQPGANQQHHRQRDLDDHEGFAQAAAAPRPAGQTGAVL
jgi:hypothetical protein